MWKAIGWGLAGLVLGVVLGGPLGAALGAVAGTVIGSVAGALHFHHHRSRSGAMCEAKSSAVPRGPLLAVAAVGVVALMASALSALSGAVEALALVILAVDLVAVVVTWRVVRYGRAMRPARVQSRDKVHAGLRVVTARSRAAAGIAAPLPELPVRQPFGLPPVVKGEVISRREHVPAPRTR